MLVWNMIWIICNCVSPASNSADAAVLQADNGTHMMGAEFKNKTMTHEHQTAPSCRGSWKSCKRKTGEQIRD